MKKTKKVTIDLLAFIKQGVFDVLKTGQTRDWVLQNFPNPDDFEDGESWRDGEFEIFTYGDFELHFSYDVLYLIFADYQGLIDAGDSLVFVNEWVFEKDTSALNLPYVIEELKKENINFTTEKKDTLYTIIVELESKVTLHFESDESDQQSDYLFTAMGIFDKTLLTRKQQVNET